MPPVRRPLLAFAAVALVAPQLACIAKGKNAPTAGTDAPGVTLTVRNDNPGDHTIFLLVGQERQRMWSRSRPTRSSR